MFVEDKAVVVYCVVSGSGGATFTGSVQTPSVQSKTDSLRCVHIYGYVKMHEICADKIWVNQLFYGI